VLIPYLIELFPQNTLQFKKIQAVQQGKGALTGFKYFPYSDFTAYHTANVSVLVKTLSTRTLATESINNENLKGHLLNSGDTYYLRNGKEYFNLAPVWNWQYLPGITTFKGADKIKKMPFAGGTGNATSGLTAMDYIMTDKDSVKSIHARKLWAFHNSLAVTLIAEVERKNAPDSVVTVLDQSRLQGKVRQGNNWLYHNKFAYYLLGPQHLELTQGPVTGSWRQVDGAASNRLVSDSIFLAKLVHPATGQSALGYAVKYAKDVAAAKAFNWTKAFKIITNTGQCQAIQFQDKTVMAAFYAPGVIKISSTSLTVNKACLIQLTKGKLYLSDPLHTGGSLNITYGKANYTVHANPDGTTTQINL
jgi:chondroitin AC lyase